MHAKSFLGIAAGAALSLAAVQASAHHGWAGQGEDQFELTGKVHQQVDLSGPHATMQIVDEKGQVWDITLAPSARTSRAGLSEDTLPVGAEVTVSGHRNSNMSRFEIKTERVTYNGKNYDVYPDRIS